MSKKKTTVILDKKQISQKIIRIAYEIYEHNFEKKSIVIAGIEGSGFELSKRIYKKINEISDKKVEFASVKINKQKPLSEPIELICSNLSSLKGKTIVVTDDVINSGTTMAFAVYHLLQYGFDSIKVAVLVDRLHRQYPVKADYVGISLSTTLQDHVQVDFKSELAYLV